MLARPPYVGWWCASDERFRSPTAEDLSHSRRIGSNVGASMLRIVVRHLASTILLVSATIGGLTLLAVPAAATSRPLPTPVQAPADHVEPSECDEFGVGDDDALLLNGVPLTDAELADMGPHVQFEPAKWIGDTLRMVANAQARPDGDTCLDADVSATPATLNGHVEFCGPVRDHYVPELPSKTIITVGGTPLSQSLLTTSVQRLAEVAEATAAEACFVLLVTDNSMESDLVAQLCGTVAAIDNPDDPFDGGLVLGYADTVFAFEPEDIGWESVRDIQYRPGETPAPVSGIVDPDGLIAEPGGTVVSLDVDAFYDPFDDDDGSWPLGMRLTVTGPTECPNATPLPPEVFAPASPNPDGLATPRPYVEGVGGATAPIPTATLAPSATATPSPTPTPSPSPSSSLARGTPLPTPSPTVGPSASLAQAPELVSSAAGPGPSGLLPLLLLSTLGFLGIAGALGRRWYQMRRTPTGADSPPNSSPPASGPPAS